MENKIKRPAEQGDCFKKLELFREKERVFQKNSMSGREYCK